jgi:hypothetical protein
MTRNPIDKLIPFTGFYALEGHVGGFVLIDTNLVYHAAPAPDTMPTKVNEATVSICIDGTTINNYAFPDYCSYDGHHLMVHDGNKPIAQLAFGKDYANGNISAFTGIIGGHAVHGTSPFNPIQLPLFAGEYYELVNGAYQPRLQINADFSVFYQDGTSGFEPVAAYGFNYAMFVIQMVTKGGQTITYEMGTTPKNGLVAGDATKGAELVTIQKTNFFPPPKS